MGVRNRMRVPPVFLYKATEKAFENMPIETLLPAVRKQVYLRVSKSKEKR